MIFDKPCTVHLDVLDPACASANVVQLPPLFISLYQNKGYSVILRIALVFLIVMFYWRNLFVFLDQHTCLNQLHIFRLGSYLQNNAQYYFKFWVKYLHDKPCTKLNDLFYFLVETLNKWAQTLTTVLFWSRFLAIIKMQW